MPRRVTPLSAAKVRMAGPGRYADGDGLYLFVRRPAGLPNAEATVAAATCPAFWVFRYVLGGHLREMGLGRARGTNTVSLAEARVAASPLWRLVRNGKDPLEQRKAEAQAARATAQAAQARAITFRAVATFYLDAHEHGWRNAKHRQQWQNTLDTYAMPHMGDLPVAEVGTAQVLASLEPIWREKPETAQRVRGRIEVVLNYATTREWRSGENPARWRGHLANLLPARSKVAPVEHHAALPWGEIGTFMKALQGQDGIAALALRAAILTAARTGEVIGARWSEFNLSEAIWKIPSQRMKAGREHRVPLSSGAMEILRYAAELGADNSADAYVFSGARSGRPLSNMAMTMVLRRMEHGEMTVHGFRSTFRDWCAEATTHGREVAEAALAHAVGDKVEAAYRRGDLFTKRRRLMEDWSAFCQCDTAMGQITPLRRAG